MQSESKPLSTRPSPPVASIPRRRQRSFPREEPVHRTKPDPLLWALSLMILTNVWRLQDLVPALAALKLNLIATALTLALLALDRDPARHLGKLKSPILFCLVAVFGLAIIGVPTSLWARRSITFLVRDFLPNLLLLGAVAATVRGVRDLYWIAMVNVLGACFFSLFVQLRFEVGPTGRLGHLVYYDANDLALVLVCTIPFAVFFLVRKGVAYHLLALGSLVLFVATLAKTGSRGGFLGLVAVLLYMLVGYRAIRTRVRLLASVGVFGMLGLVASEAYWETISTLRAPQQDYNWAGGSPEGRMEVWRRGLRYIAADPVLGVGLGSFPLAEGMLSDVARARAERGAGFKWSAAHNTFLEIAVELGLIAFALFVAAMVLAFRALHRIRAARPLDDPGTLRRVAFACTLLTSLVGFIVSGFFISATSFSYFYVLLGLTIGLAKIHGDRTAPAEWFDRRFHVAGRLAGTLRNRVRSADHMPVSSTGRLARRARDSGKRG